jgi:hypothetical protein
VGKLGGDGGGSLDEVCCICWTVVFADIGMSSLFHLLLCFTGLGLQHKIGGFVASVCFSCS